MNVYPPKVVGESVATIQRMGDNLLAVLDKLRAANQVEGKMTVEITVGEYAGLVELMALLLSIRDGAKRSGGIIPTPKAPA
jgi:hypothetical protein